MGGGGEDTKTDFKKKTHTHIHINKQNKQIATKNKQHMSQEKMENNKTKQNKSLPN